MSTTVSDLIVKVAATGVEQTKAGLGQVSGMLSSFPAIGAFAGAGLAAGLVAGGVAATKMAGDFQESMTQLVTGAGESKSNLALVSNGILDMAVQTGTSTQQLAAGMFMIESAGLHGQAGLDALAAAAKGAKVGNADLATVADAETTIMTDYASKHISAANAVNLLTAVVANGKTHMQDLAGAMSSVLPTAAAYHVQLGDVGAALATMTAAGVPAADAATYLKQTLIGLGSPTSAAAKALKSVGLTTDDVNSELKKSLPDTLKMITDAVGKKFPEGSVAYNEAIKAIAGGSKQMQGMLDLTGTHLATFQGDVGTISDAVKKGGNSILGWSDVQGDFNQKLSVAGQVVNTLMIRIGTNLLPVVGNMVTAFATALPVAVTDATNAFNTASTAVNWIVTNFHTLEPILSGVAAVILTAMVPSMITAGTAAVASFGAAATAAWAFTVALLANPMTWIALAIGAGVAIIILAIQHWGQITSWLGNLWGNVFNAVQATIQNAGSFIGGVANDIGGFFENLGGRINTFVGNIVLWFNQLPGQIEQAGIDMIQGFINGILSMAGSVASALGGVIHGAVSAIPGGAALAHLAGIPGFALGGIVPGMPGEPQLIIAHGGERVLPVGTLPGGGGGGNVTVIVQPPDIYLDGQRLSHGLLPHMVKAFSVASGDRSH